MPQITDVTGITVGHAEDARAVTGCTVVLCEQGGVGGVDVRGSAPGTRETDALRPMNLVERVHGVLLTGGSAFGLAAADGVMRFLEERGIGFDVSVAKVPLVAAAVIFDLMIGNPAIRPTAEMGYAAARAASRGPVAEGSVGAGTGATVGKLMGPLSAMKGGVGTWAAGLPGGVVVGALVVVNAYGDVRDDHTGQILAGARDRTTGRFLNMTQALMSGHPSAGFGTNTTLAVVATNAALTKEQANKLAQLGHDGLARVIAPVHTMYDGDTVFALSTGNAKADMIPLGTAVVEAVAEAVKRAVRLATGLGGIPGLADTK
ncbi:MAG: P1 family peptidase [Bacillati bacterium ANGP1]|uniref:P1 family peptidase n=1 Tax=Candidatus Segetimicrobium genomatis TaxID=2569760 RepID=A0A537ITP4_9BACT|nr:MAG: P1 family peptidase [Terrabacteria group bacterium ANGP1]